MKPVATYTHFRVPKRRCTKRAGKPGMRDLRYYNQSDPDFVPAERGGLTHCTLTWNGFEAHGVSHCSLSDHFNYATGRQIAFERAEDDLWNQLSKRLFLHKVEL